MANYLNTRICLKYDLFSEWKSKNPVLLAGEVAIAVPGDKLADINIIEKSAEKAASPCLMKVGDGTHHFNDLPWLSALAADVHTWAKKSEDEFRTWLTSSDGPALATEADLAKAEARIAKLEETVDTATTGLKDRMTAAEGRLDTVEDDIDTLEGKVQTLETLTGAGEGTLLGRIEALEADNTTNKGNISDNTAAIAENSKNIQANTNAITILNGNAETAGSVAKTVADAVKVEKDRAELAESGLQTAIDTLNGTGDGSVAKAVAGEAALREAADNALGLRIDGVEATAGAADTLSKANKGRLDTLIGSDADMSVRAIAAAEINTLIGAADDEGGKTIQNIANLVDYVEENAGDIAQLISDVDTNGKAITKANEDISDLQEKDVELAGDIQDINDKIGTGTLPQEKTTLIESLIAVDSAATAAAAKAKTDAVTEANSYTDGKVTEINTANSELAGRVKANEDKLVNIGGENQPATVVAAIEAAENRAAADATSKAGTAKSEAIAAAATDAQTKANTAESNANTYTNTEIGKVNSALTEYKKNVITGATDENNNLTLSLGGTAITELVFVCGNATI